MGVSDLHILATDVLETDKTLKEVAENSSYSKDDIEWAVEELKQAENYP